MLSNFSKTASIFTMLITQIDLNNINKTCQNHLQFQFPFLHTHISHRTAIKSWWPCNIFRVWSSPINFSYTRDRYLSRVKRTKIYNNKKIHEMRHLANCNAIILNYTCWWNIYAYFHERRLYYMTLLYCLSAAFSSTRRHERSVLTLAKTIFW